MRSVLSKFEVGLLMVMIAVLVGVSIRQHKQLRALQLDQKKAHYAVRLRTAHRILEDEMLRSAYFTAPDERTRKLARHYLEKAPQ
jgi:hypothetical protein